MAAMLDSRQGFTHCESPCWTSELPLLSLSLPYLFASISRTLPFSSSLLFLFSILLYPINKELAFFEDQVSVDLFMIYIDKDYMECSISLFQSIVYHFGTAGGTRRYSLVTLLEALLMVCNKVVFF